VIFLTCYSFAIFLAERAEHVGTTIFGVTTFDIMTFGIKAFGITTLSIMTLGIMALSITTFSIMILSIKGLLVTLSINEMTLSIKTLWI